MGRAERMRQMFVRAHRWDPEAIAILALFVASILVPFFLGLRRHFNRDRRQE